MILHNKMCRYPKVFNLASSNHVYFSLENVSLNMFTDHDESFCNLVVSKLIKFISLHINNGLNSLRFCFLLSLQAVLSGIIRSMKNFFLLNARFILTDAKSKPLDGIGLTLRCAYVENWIYLFYLRPGSISRISLFFSSYLSYSLLCLRPGGDGKDHVSSVKSVNSCYSLLPHARSADLTPLPSSTPSALCVKDGIFWYSQLEFSLKINQR